MTTTIFILHFLGIPLLTLKSPTNFRKSVANTMMKQALEGMIKRQSVSNAPVATPSTTSASSPPSSSNCVFVTDKKPRRKAASENFAVANSQTKNGMVF